MATSDWTTLAYGLEVQGIYSLLDYSINIPPARRHGQRESAKENVAVAEFSAIEAQVEAQLATLSTDIDDYSVDAAAYVEERAGSMEAARSKTEAR